MSIALGCLAGSSAAEPVAAECTRVSPWPSFRETADSADTVFIGTVSHTALQDPDAYSPTFTLVVDDVLRGAVGDQTLAFRRLHSGAPEPYCPEDSVLRVQTGDRLAFADGAELEGQPITAVAFVAPSEPDPGLMPGMEQLTEAEIRAIVGVPTSSTSPSGSPQADNPQPTGSHVPPVDCRDEFPDVTGGRDVTDAQLAQLCRDAYLSTGIDPVASYAMTQPDFAGLITRRGTDPGWTIWFTMDLARHEAALEPLRPDGWTVTLLPAELTLMELEEIQARISADLTELLAMGMEIEEVGVDPARNAVVVGLREESPGAALILQQRYGPHVVTEAVGAT